LLDGRPCHIYGDGEQTRDYVYVGDVAEAARAALACTAGGVVNVSTARETTVNALYAQLCASLGVSRPPAYDEARPGDVRRSVLDNGRARAVLGWTPRTSLEEGLALTIRSFRS
jgi:UDP-glucose 4-epimerase